MARVIRRSEALARGLSSDDVQRRRHRKEWISLRPGSYITATTASTLGPVQRHLVLIDATMPVVGSDLVLSHTSAACLLGIDLWRPSLSAVQVTRPGANTGHRRRSLHSFRAPIEADEIITVRGLRVTSPARTIVDLARMTSFEAGVVAADAALHAGLTTFAELRNAVDRAPRRPGIGKARQVIAFADPRSESVGESRSRVLISRQGLPPPQTQCPVRDHRGEVFARGDFGWTEQRTIGEFDGAQKYGRLLRDGFSAGDRIYQEKLREDRIRDAGIQVVRWTWDDLQHPAEVAARIVRAFDRGRSWSKPLR